MSRMDKSAIERACDAVGGQVKLADAIGVTPQAVNQWVSRQVVPVDRVREIVRAVENKVTAHDLAPSIFPKGFTFPPDTKPERKRAAA